MSAYQYLKFAVGVVVVAVLAAVVNEFVLPMIATAKGQSTTEASATGIMWFEAAWTWMPLLLLVLLVFMLIVGIVVRRQSVGGIP